MHHGGRCQLIPIVSADNEKQNSSGNQRVRKNRDSTWEAAKSHVLQLQPTCLILIRWQYTRSIVKQRSRRGIDSIRLILPKTSIVERNWNKISNMTGAHGGWPPFPKPIGNLVEAWRAMPLLAKFRMKPKQFRRRLKASGRGSLASTIHSLFWGE